jgi:hypothetical protein
MRHFRLELPSVSPIFSALNISIGHPPSAPIEFREKVALSFGKKWQLSN